MKLLILVFLPILAQANPDSICGSDERAPSQVKEIGRVNRLGEETGCTITLIGKTCAVTAGHCLKYFQVALFNTFMDNGILVATAEDTYQVDATGVLTVDNNEGKDWGVLRLKANEKSGKFAGDVQGHLPVNLTSQPKIGDMVSITGFGFLNSQHTKNSYQQTHTDTISSVSGARLGHKVDTMGGNSGSSLLDENGSIIGVHTHGFCGPTRGENIATLISKTPRFQKAITDCLAWEAQNL